MGDNIKTATITAYEGGYLVDLDGHGEIFVSLQKAMSAIKVYVSGSAVTEA